MSLEEKRQGNWCDFCGKKHSGRCEKVPTKPTQQEEKWKTCPSGKKKRGRNY